MAHKQRACPACLCWAAFMLKMCSWRQQRQARNSSKAARQQLAAMHGARSGWRLCARRTVRRPRLCCHSSATETGQMLQQATVLHQYVQFGRPLTKQDAKKKGVAKDGAELQCCIAALGTGGHRKRKQTTAEGIGAREALEGGYQAFGDGARASAASIIPVHSTQHRAACQCPLCRRPSLVGSGHHARLRLPDVAVVLRG